MEAMQLSRKAGANDEGGIRLVLETLALFFVVASIVVMVLALTTVFQNGFR